MRYACLALVCVACGTSSPSDATTSGSTSTEPATSGTSLGSTSLDTSGRPDGTSTSEDPDTTAADTTDTSTTPPACDEDTLVVTDLAPLAFTLGDDPSEDPSCTEVRNPGRGFYRTMDLRDADPEGLADRFADGYRLVYGRVLIPEYVDQPLDDALLGSLDEGLVAIRDAGLQVIPRVYYPDNQDDPDATLEVALGHIAQLDPTWHAHGDVIAVVQAGFVGAWGEWHGSMSGLDTPAARGQLLDALLGAVPEDRMIEVRRPSFKQVAFGGPLDLAGAHGTDDLARIAHHNDCFLASEDDSGTYQERGEREYMEADAPFTFNGGETCAVNPPRSECESALAELELLHFSMLNEEYHPDVLQSWRDDGCFAQIECRLGYRLLVTRVRAPETAAPGSTAAVELSLLDDGWASLQNPRPIAIVLRNGEQELRADLDFDPRTVMPGETASFCAAIDIPADASGTWDVAVHMPDASDSLADRSEYAVRIANANWDAATGLNVLPVAIAVQ